MKHAKKILFDLISQIAIILLYLFLSTILVNLFKNKILYNSLFANTLMSILIELINLTIFIIIFRKIVVPEFYDFKENYKNYISNYWIYWFIGLVIMYISNNIISSFIGLPTNESNVREIFSIMPIYIFTTAVIIAPIFEELLTRVVLRYTFKHSWIYYIISGLIFGSLHLTSINNIYEILFIIPYGSLGVCFAIMCHKSKNVWTNIFFHSLHNFIAILILFISTRGVL